MPGQWRVPVFAVVVLGKQLLHHLGGDVAVDTFADKSFKISRRDFRLRSSSAARRRANPASFNKPSSPPAPRRRRHCGRRTYGRAFGTTPRRMVAQGQVIHGLVQCAAGFAFCAVPQFATLPGHHPDAARHRQKCFHPARMQIHRQKQRKSAFLCLFDLR